MNPTLAFCLGGLLWGLTVWFTLSERTRHAESATKHALERDERKTEEIRGLNAMLTQRDEEINRLLLKIKDLTPKRGEHGRFVSKTHSALEDQAGWNPPNGTPRPASTHPLDTVEMP